MSLGSPRVAQLGAVGLLAATLGGALVLLGPGEARPSAGWVEEDRRTLGFTERGHLLEVRVTEGQAVVAGEVLAQLDPALVDAEIAAVEAASRAAAERGRTRALGAGHDRSESRGRATAAVQEARAARADALARRQAVIELEAQIARGLGGGDRLGALRADAASAEAHATGLEATAAAIGREPRADASLSPDDAAEAEREALDRQIAALKVRREALTVRAPVDGRVAAVHHRPGDILDAGLPVVELVGAAVDRAIACVDARTAAALQPSQRVLVAQPAVGATVAGQVLAIGPAYAEADDRCRLGPYQPGWVLPVVVRLEPASGFVPGATVQFRWLDEIAPFTPDDDLRVRRNPT